MPTEFKIPELGENVTAGDVVRVLVSNGDTLAKDQPVLELETDKATIEVPSSVSGTVKDIKVKQGERVKVGQVVLTVDDGGEAQAKDGKSGEKPAAEPAPKAAAAPKDDERPKPQSIEAAVEGGLSQKATAGDKPAESQAPPPEREDASRQKRRGEVVEISRGARTATPPVQQPPAPAGEADIEGVPAAAAPSVRRLARELGVDIRRISGSGEGGRIVPDDVQAFVRAAMAGGGATASAAQPLPDLTKWGDVERKPMSNIRRKTAEHLSHAWNAIPHVTQHDKADITALEPLRKQYGPQAEKAGGKLTMTAVALKVVAGAMKRFPQFNASVDAARSEIVYKKAVHVGVAVDTERGLLVPVIRDVDRKGIIELSVELTKLSEKARAGKLSLDEMQGGGCTITNLGGIGGTLFTPIVNWPEVAILGISRSAQEPVWTGAAFEPRLMLPLSLSYDHRVIDGADAARALRWIAEAFEQPLVLAL
jgi:pyruvate dehydrogenase E2 component (dihydrolipoamide acetyltransferase)